MKFQDNNTIFELKIRGYEFPEIGDEEYNSNWVVASFGLKEKLKPWKRIDWVTFLTWEIKDLPIWLNEVLNNQEKSKVFGELLEPCLQITKTKKTSDKVYLKIEPFWGMIEERWKGPRKFILEIEVNKFKKQVKSLKKELKKFPERLGWKK